MVQRSRGARGRKKTIATRFALECKPENLWEGMNNLALLALCDSSNLTSKRPLVNTWCLTVLFGVRYHTGFRRARSLPKPAEYLGPEQSWQISYSCYPILEDIETLILPVSAATAFDLLVLTVERDEDVMIQCGDFLAVGAGMTRAAALLTIAAKSLPSAEVIKTIQRLVREGDFGLRMPLFRIGMAGNDSDKGVSGEKPGTMT
jgi:hypothetical protein